ncbi:MAG: hypothetical protein RR846_00595 [Oscillospiraceae bacterium]
MKQSKPSTKTLALLIAVLLIFTFTLTGCNNDTYISSSSKSTSTIIDESSDNIENNNNSANPDNIDISELLKKENPTDKELEKIALELSKPKNNVQAWFLDGSCIDIVPTFVGSPEILQNEDPNDQGIYVPVGRFNTMDELLYACFNLVTEASMKNYFYDFIYTDRENSVPYPAFKEVDGKLYYNTGCGAGVPLFDYTSADVASRETETKVIMLLHFKDPSSNDDDSLEIKIQYENGSWKKDYLFGL